MSGDNVYDDKQLEWLFADMDVKRRTQALKGAFQRVASKVRNAAVRNLRATGMHAPTALTRGIRAQVFKRTAGFRVTIRPSGKKGLYESRHSGKPRPILIFAELGTPPRKTKNSLKVQGKRGAAHSTGSMPAYRFMEATRTQMSGTVTDELGKQLEDSVIRTAKKYGCQ